MRFTAFIAFVCVACSIGHNVLTSPASRGGNAGGGNTNQPCDSGVYAAGTSQFTAYAGESISMGFTQNHVGNDQYVSIAAYSTNDANFGAGITLATQHWTRGPGDGQGPTGGTMTAPSNYGLNTLRWTWDNWVNCVDFTILARPPTDAEETDVDLNGDDITGEYAGYMYLTADEHGLFNAMTGELVCDEGWIDLYDEESGELIGCQDLGVSSGDVIYATIELNFGSDNVDEVDGWSEDDDFASFIDALSDALNCDPEQIEVWKFTMDTDSSSMTLVFKDGDDSTAVEVYTEFSTQYRDGSSVMNSQPLLAWINTDVAIETTAGSYKDPNSAASLSFGAAAVAAVAGALLL